MSWTKQNQNRLNNLGEGVQYGHSLTPEEKSELKELMERKRRYTDQEETKKKEANKQEKDRVSKCYQANEVNGKYQCPECKAVEGGTLRIISHYVKCPNTGKEYCQRYASGGKRTSKKTRKQSRKVRKGTYRKRR